MALSKLTSFDGYPFTSRWTVPDEDREVQAVALLLPGSGDVGVDGDVSAPGLGNGYQGQRANLNDQLAVRLAEMGVASFRYAKRGVEHPDQSSHRSLDFLLRDARSAFEEIENAYPDTRKFIIGFSEGALLSLLLARLVRLDGLFFLGLPTRPIDEIIEYQCIHWPLKLLSKLPADSHSPTLEPDDLLPVLNVPWSSIARDPSTGISVTRDLLQAYQAHHASVLKAVTDASLVRWYSSLKALPNLRELAAGIQVPKYIYQGLDDAQLNPEWVISDIRAFEGDVEIRTYSGMGHCFSPMEGTLGQIKTSGPFCTELLEDIARDIARELT